MKCDKCGTENSDKFKFCINCGSKLEKKPVSSGKFCPECGAENKPGNKFCINCGFKLADVQKKVIATGGNQIKEKKKTKHQPQRKKHAKEKNLSLLEEIKNHKIAVAAVAIIAGYFLFQSIPNEPTRTYTGVTNYPQTTIPVGGNPLATEIASMFVCSCGSCGEQPLETCTCPTAEEERTFILDKISQNLSKDEIVIAVANTYGWLESQYYPKYKVDKSKVWFGGTTELTGTTGGNLVATNNLSNIATIADRYTIISSFECPCGQCGIPELTDCNCNHPNGALEVKGYIDRLIAAGNLSVEQIINEVDKKYGGRKI